VSTVKFFYQAIALISVGIFRNSLKSMSAYFVFIQFDV